MNILVVLTLIPVILSIGLSLTPMADSELRTTTQEDDVILTEEEEEKIHQRCLANIQSNATVAERRVAEDECENILKQFYRGSWATNTIIDDHKQRIEACLELHHYYEILGKEQSLRLSGSTIARQCVDLYQDPVWNYVGEDRMEKLLNWYNEYTTTAKQILSEKIDDELGKDITLSPRKQMENGVAAEDVSCKSGLALMIRISGDAACVKPTTAEKLTMAGWGIIEKEATMIPTTLSKCPTDEILIRDKTDNLWCVDAQKALHMILDGATITDESTLKTSQLITNLALSSLDSKTLGLTEIFNIATLAYVYGYSPVDVYEARELMIKDPDTDEFSINVMDNFRELLGPDWTAVVSPNRDTLYSPTYLDLSREPLVFHVPDVGDRYYTFQMIDFYTNNFDYIGKRTTGTTEANFVIVGPGWNGEIPTQLQRFDSPTPSIFHLGRTLVSGEQDLPEVHAIQDEYTLTKLSDWKEGKISIFEPYSYAPYQTEGDFAFFHNMNVALTENPPPSNEQNLVDLFAKIKLGPGQTFEDYLLDNAVKKSIKDAIFVGDRIVTYGSDNVGKKINGWHIPSPETGEFGENFILRAGTSKSMLYLNSPEEAMYPKALEDLDGNLLNGQNRYIIHFDAEEIPPVDAFWSVTMYNSDFLLVDNEIDRYNIGDRTPGLKYGEDGSLDILIQHETPENISNWLPTPEDGFYLINRLYNPQESALNGEWVPQGVEKQTLN